MNRMIGIYLPQFSVKFYPVESAETGRVCAQNEYSISTRRPPKHDKWRLSKAYIFNKKKFVKHPLSPIKQRLNTQKYAK